MREIKWYLLSIGSFVLFVALAPLVFHAQLLYRVFSKKYDVQYYLESTAIGNDSTGGSYLYGSKFHTISAMTGYFASLQCSKWHKIQEKIIDFFFGEGHCKRVAIEEKMIKERQNAK